MTHHATQIKAVIVAKKLNGQAMQDRFGAEFMLPVGNPAFLTIQYILAL